MPSCQDCILPQLVSFVQDEYVKYIRADLESKGMDKQFTEEIVSVIFCLYKLKVLEMLKQQH